MISDKHICHYPMNAEQEIFLLKKESLYHENEHVVTAQYSVFVCFSVSQQQ